MHAALVLGINGRSVVSNSLKQENIVGTPDMTPAAIREEAQGEAASQYRPADLHRRRQADRLW